MILLRMLSYGLPLYRASCIPEVILRLVASHLIFGEGLRHNEKKRIAEQSIWRTENGCLGERTERNRAFIRETVMKGRIDEPRPE